MASPSKLQAEGYLEKRQRGRSKPKSDDLEFQKRYFQLCGKYLTYYKDGKPGGLTTKCRGTFPINNVRIVETVEESVFRKKFCFKVGDEEEVLYLACKSSEERSYWMEAFMKAAKMRGNEMLSTHHNGVYLRKISQWSCCKKSKFEEGCSPTHKDQKTMPKNCVSIPTSEPVSDGDSVQSDSREDDEIISWKNMAHLQTYIPTNTSKVMAMKIISKNVIVLVFCDYSVQIFDIPSNAVVHKIGLTHPIASIDEWNGYLLIGSSLIHVVDTSKHHSQWCRTVVIDTEEHDSIENPNSYLAVFNKTTGEFVTAKMKEQRLKLWPKPTRFDGPITKYETKFEITGKIMSLYFANETYLVFYKSVNNAHVDIMKWNATERLISKSITLDGSMFSKQIAVSDDGEPHMVTIDQVEETTAEEETKCVVKNGEYVYMIKDLGSDKLGHGTEDKPLMLQGNVKNQDKITSIADSCLRIGNNSFVVTGYRSGRVKINDTKNQQPIHSLESYVPGAIIAVACRQGENLVAAATEKGDLVIWGESKEVYGKGKSSIDLLEIEKFSVYMSASFSRHSIITDMFHFVANSKGGRFVNRPSYSLEIPPGAIKVGEEVPIQTAMIKFVGSDRFRIPEEYSVVSPVVWFCKEKDDDFLQPLTIELQHCAENSSHLRVLKAKCSITSEIFEFEPLDLEEEVNINEDKYISFKTNHFCIYCVGVETSRPRTVCVIPIEGEYSRNTKDVIFCVCYNLDTCIKAVKEQYENGSHYCKRNSIVAGALQGSSNSITFNCDSQSAMMRSGTSVVTLESLRYSHMTTQELYHAHKERIYPPSVRYGINAQSQDHITFSFTGLNGQTYTFEVEAKIMSTPSSDEDIAKMFPGSHHMNGFHFHEPDYHHFH